MADDRHTLVVVNPGHFHAALTLRMPHPRLREDVYVYAEDGPDLERFLDIVKAFNTRACAPTRWKLHVHRGSDHLERLLLERPGRLAVVAGRNDRKMALIAALHQAGFLVLGDKPWTIGPQQLDALRSTASSAPLAMDIMTERHEVSVRLLKALMQVEEVFGVPQGDAQTPALSLRSVHHLYKLVNGRPLVRPAWYFDVGAQGEGITDVNTHLVDLVQWMLGEGQPPCDCDRDVELLCARQWPTAVPRELFCRITGLDDFPAALQPAIAGGCLQYLCNAVIAYRLRGVPIRIEALWDLAIPEGGGDTHCFKVRGTRADLTVTLDATTRFRTELTVDPRQADGFQRRLSAALASLQQAFPGIAAQPSGAGFRIDVPDALRTTHEEHFAAVLDEFIEHADSGRTPVNLAGDLVAKYTLLQRARERSHAD